MSQTKDGHEMVWVFPRENPPLREHIIKEFKIHPVMAQVLVSRGFKTDKEIQEFLYSRLRDLQDPYLFPDMSKATKRIGTAIQNNECILIYGDNDVDGMTGTALLTEFLKFVGANVKFSLSKPGGRRTNIIIDALQDAMEYDCKLLITVDCGITSAEEVGQYTSRGIDVIITDHHEPTDTLPTCTAILNPKLEGEDFAYRHLVGVGVAFKLAHGIANYLITQGMLDPKKVDLKRYLDLVALGTISDMGALLGENRILVKYGIEQLKQTKRIGLTKLVSVSDVEMEQINTMLIATKIAPRMNSLGRIADPRKGVELLLLRDTEEAEKLAVELDLNNIERQRIERSMSSDVEEMIKGNPQLTVNKAIVLASENWHPGVIAIISTRISKQYNRPTIVIAIDNGIGKGSIRSIPEFPVLSTLKKCSDILMNFGGHDLAAGLSIKAEHIEEFTERFLAAANEILKEEDIKSKLHLDAWVRFDELTVDCMESLSLLEPFGNENPQPVFFTQATQVWPPKVVGKHLKVFLAQGERMLEGFCVGRGSQAQELKRRELLLDIVYNPQMEFSRTQNCLKIFIRDFKINKD